MGLPPNGQESYKKESYYVSKGVQSIVSYRT